MPKTISFHYLSLPSNLKTPITLFRMATASAPGRPGPNSLRFGIVGGNSRGHFVMQRSDRQTLRHSDGRSIYPQGWRQTISRGEADPV